MLLQFGKSVDFELQITFLNIYIYVSLPWSFGTGKITFVTALITVFGGPNISLARTIKVLEISEFFAIKKTLVENWPSKFLAYNNSPFQTNFQNIGPHKQ